MNATEEIIEVERRADLLVLTPRRDLRELEFQEIEQELRRIADDPSTRCVVVDLGRTDYFGSTGLGMLTLLGQKVCGRGGRVAFCHLSAHEREIVSLTGLAEFWPVYPSRDEAIRAVSACDRC